MAASRVNLEQLQPWLYPWMLYALDYMQLVSGGRYDAKGRITGGVRPTVTSGYRSVERQAELYADRANNPYPVNRPGDSAHNYGLAFDSSFAPKEKAKWMPTWIAVRQSVGFRVPENDPVHAEYPYWRQLVGR